MRQGKWYYANEAAYFQEVQEPLRSTVVVNERNKDAGWIPCGDTKPLAVRWVKDELGKKEDPKVEQDKKKQEGEGAMKLEEDACRKEQNEENSKATGTGLTQASAGLGRDRSWWDSEWDGEDVWPTERDLWNTLSVGEKEQARLDAVALSSKCQPAVLSQGVNHLTNPKSKSSSPSHPRQGTLKTATLKGRGRKSVSNVLTTARPPIWLKMLGQPWLKVTDTIFAAAVGKTERSSLSRAVAAELSWDVKEKDEQLRASMKLGREEKEFTWEIHAEDSPSAWLGDDVLKWLIEKGWSLDIQTWEAGKEICFEPEVTDGELIFGSFNEQEDVEQGEDGVTEEGMHAKGDPSMLDIEMRQEEADALHEQQEEDSFWEDIVKRHQLEAVDGEEAGGLISGEEWEPDTHVLQEMESLKELAADLPSGPHYSTPEDNAEEFKGKEEAFTPGNVHKYVSVWARDDPLPHSEVLRILSQGVVVRVPKKATGIRSRNGKIAQKNQEDLAIMMSRRLEQGSYEAVPAESLINIIGFNLAEKPTASPPWRLITVAIPINEEISKYSVKYESLKKLPFAVTPNCWMISLDLESGYDQILFHKDTKPLFGAKFYASAAVLDHLHDKGLLPQGSVGPKDKKGGAWVFVQPNTMVQGYSRACVLFTKVTRQRVRVWRRRGIRCLHLLDDFLICAATYEQCVEHRDFIISDLVEHGFLISWKKSVLTPTQSLKFLGFIVCSTSMRIYTPGDKIEKIEELAKKLLESEGKQETFRTLARMAGKIVSLAAAIPPARLFTRETYKCIRPENEEAWDDKAEVSVEMLQEIKFMLEHIRKFNQVGARIRKQARMCDLRILSDASSGGFGYRLDGEDRSMKWQNQGKAVAVEWDKEDSEQVFREMQAVEEAVIRETSALKNRTVLIGTDSVAVKKYVNEATGKSEVLTKMARRLWWHCANEGISLRSEHFAGVRLVEACVDGLSRSAEFCLRRSIWKQLNNSERWGRRWGFTGFNVDACASEKTRQCMEFYSKCGLGKNSKGDIRTAKLQQDKLYYVCPPIGFIDKVCELFQEAKVCAIFIVPNWEGT